MKQAWGDESRQKVPRLPHTLENKAHPNNLHLDVFDKPPTQENPCPNLENHRSRFEDSLSTCCRKMGCVPCDVLTLGQFRDSRHKYLVVVHVYMSLSLSLYKPTYVHEFSYICFFSCSSLAAWYQGPLNKRPKSFHQVGALLLQIL